MTTTERLLKFASEYRERQRGVDPDWPALRPKVKVWEPERELAHCHALSESVAMREAKQRLAKDESKQW